MEIKNQKGFLLIDAVLAMLVITVALVAIAGMYTKSLQANTKAGKYTIATNVAQQRMEEVKRDIEERRNNIVDWNKVTYPVTTNASSNEIPNSTIETVASLYTPSDLACKIVVITVTVKWSDTTGNDIVTMSTYGLRNTTFSTFPRN